MFVCGMFLELGFEVVLNLTLTLVEPSVLEFWFKCFVSLCTFLWACVLCGFLFGLHELSVQDL